MTVTIRGISVSFARDMSFNEPVLNQSTVHLLTAGDSIEQFTESRARRTLLQGFNVRAVVIEGCVIGVGGPMMGRLRVRIVWRSTWEAA